MHTDTGNFMSPNSKKLWLYIGLDWFICLCVRYACTQSRTVGDRIFIIDDCPYEINKRRITAAVNETEYFTKEKE